jgi:hypothetical protein
MVANGPSVLDALGTSSVPDQESFPLGETKKSPLTALASNGCHNSLRNNFPSLVAPVLIVCALVAIDKVMPRHKDIIDTKSDILLQAKRLQ